MKRSTITLLIVLAVMIFAPIIAIKIIDNCSPESKIKTLKTLAKEWNPDAPIRYLIIDDDSATDSVCSLITISTRASKGDPRGTTLIGTQSYDKDTLILTGEWLKDNPAATPTDIPGEWFKDHHIVYEEETQLIIENRNPRIELLVTDANLNTLIIESPADITLSDSNLGTVVFQDSTGTGHTQTEHCNIGTLFACIGKNHSLMLSHNNIGTAFFPNEFENLSLIDNNIGITSSTDKASFNIVRSIGSDSTDTNNSIKLSIRINSEDE